MTIFETLTRDVRLALRQLIRTPGFTAMARDGSFQENPPSDRDAQRSLHR